MSNELKSLYELRECEKLEEIDFNETRLLRGETPDDIKAQCLQLCREYLSGIWIKQTMESIEVKRISGGMTNQLYFCGICEKSTEEGVEPQEVVITFYGRKCFNNQNDGNERLTDVVVAVMVSENKLGPKLYGLFTGGQINAFIRHRHFKKEDQNDDKLVTQVFSKLAIIHALDVPIKRCHWILDEMERHYEMVVKNFPLNELVNELNCETFKRHDLRSEVEWVKELVVKTNSPMVFTHNDLNGKNIMVFEDRNSSEEQIVLCDFEYASYGYRGSDFAGLIVNTWMKDGFYDFKTFDNFPDDSTLRPLIEIYIKQSQQSLGEEYSDLENNSVKQILKEVKVFSLLDRIFMVLFCMKSDDSLKDSVYMNSKLTLRIAENAYKEYWHLKERFIQENLLQ